MAKVKCLICGAEFEEGTEVCPICGVGPENFEPLYEEKKMVRRKEVPYIVSPWALTWSDENYYMIA